MTDYAEGWNRSAELHRKWSAEDQRREDARNERERAIVAASLPVIFAHPANDGALQFTRDREGRDHVATIFDGSKVGPTFTASDGWRDVTYRVERV